MQSKSILKLVCLFVVVCVCLTGLNIVTAPIIEKNAASGAFEPLFKVMPEAQGFEVLELDNVDEKIVGVYKETSGLGYAVSVSTSEGYTHEPIEFTLAFDSEGKISNIDIINNPETKDWGQDYPTSFIGQDSTLADVQLVAGVTFASKALKEATVCAFDALINNDYLSAGKMGPEQILSLLMLEKFPSMANHAGIAQYTEVSDTGFAKGFASNNETGYAFIEDEKLIVVNNSGVAAVYDLDGNDVTEANQTLVDKAVSYEKAHAFEASGSDEKKLIKLVSKESSYEKIELGNSFNSVQSAYLIDGQYYGFIVKSYGYDNDIMTEYYVLDKDGSIVSMTVKEFIIEADYFSSYTLDESSYKSGMVGLTVDTFTGEQTLISGATRSSEAITSATYDVFSAYQAIVGGNK